MVRSAVGFLLLVVLAGGCAGRTGPADKLEPGSADTPAVAASPSVRSNLFSSSEPCPKEAGGTLGHQVGCISRATGSFDDDPTDEELVVYAELDPEGFPASWHIALVDDGRVDARRYLQEASEITYPTVVGATDFDRGGNDEALVSVALHPLHGVVGQDLALFSVTDDGRIHRAAADGAAWTLTSFNIGRLGEGARCEDVTGDGRREVIATRLWSVDRQNRVWRWSERRYEWVGHDVRYIGRKTGRLRVSGYNDPDLDPYFYVRCDDVHVP